MQLDIITPDSTVFSGKVQLVQLPGLDGLFEVLHNHAPMIAVLGKGRIKVLGDDKKTLFFEIQGGMLEVLNNKLVVLAS